jgi:hypothetical protein
MKREYEEELKELSPFLSDLKKQSPREPFRTPRLYFDNLADKVVEQAKNETVVAKAPPQYNTRPTVLNRIKSWLSAVLEPRMALSVCTLALILGAGWYVINQQKTPTSGIADSEMVTQEEMHNYIHENIDEFKEEEILLAFAETKLNKAEGNTPEIKIVVPVPTTPIEAREEKGVLKHPKSGLTEEELEEYLKENLDDEDL